jgi:glucose 1-dehydrogenase
VTLAFCALGRVRGTDVFGYIAAQLLGALLGAAVLRVAWRGIAESVDGGATVPSVRLTTAFALEAAMTAVLVVVILVFVSSVSLARWTPLAIWPVIALLVWGAASYTGTSLNPARSTGPALVFARGVDVLWLYLVAPTAGALAVAFLWRRRHPGAQPKTAKLFHDPRYPCPFATELPARSPVTNQVRTHTEGPIPASDQEEQMTASAPTEAVEGMRGLEGKNVLVTGGTSGIGQAIAVRFAEYGANVAINYLRTPDEAEDTEDKVRACVASVRQMGVRDVLVQGDVSKEPDVLAMFDDAADKLGGIDVLVNNAGIQISRPSHELSAEDFDKVIAVNLRGSFLCAREAIKGYLENDTPGVVINISSVHQLIPKPNYLGYSASKGGMMNLTRTLALEYAKHGIRVNGIAPGATVTPINRAWIEDPVKREMVVSHIPLARAGTADEMAGVTCFLASDDAAYITGQTIVVDGGLTLYADFREPWSSE